MISLFRYKPSAIPLMGDKGEYKHGKLGVEEVDP
jgi:hypothetical protein